jgi:sarcosine oxidase
LLDLSSQAAPEADVLVIGGGVVGAAAALAAAERGRRTILLEAGSLSDARGSSAGAARIFAPAPFPDESYLELGLLGLERWSGIAARSGQRILHRTGALTLGAFAERQFHALRGAGVEAEFVSADEAGRRFGVRVPEDVPLLHQPNAGIIRADRALGALRTMAGAAGAELRGGERVGAITEHGDCVEATTERRTWRGSAAIVAAGPWSGALLAGAGLDAPLTVSLQSVAYFNLDGQATPPVALIEFEGDEPFACWDPERGLKAALHVRGPVVDPRHARPTVEQQAIDRVGEWIGARFPGVDPKPIAAEPCLYTNTSDERFLLERRGRIVLAGACNGQGFQFAPVVGERLARLAVEPAGLAAART